MKQPITVESILEHSLKQGLRLDDPGPWDSAQLELALD